MLAALQRQRLLEGMRCFTASGCVTALGDLEIAPDELGGFAAGALQAGAAGALATLWPVSDRVTYLLMRRFIQVVLASPDLAPTQALRDAARWLRSASATELAQVIAGDQIGPYSYHLTTRWDEDQRAGLRGIAPGLASREPLASAIATDTPASSGQAPVATHSEPAHEVPMTPPYVHPVYWAALVAYGA